MKISIITPTLNSEKSISFTLNSVFNQVYKNYEHIIVDGGSTDETLKIAKKHKVNKKIIVKKNCSIYQAINEGIKNSSGDYILVLNSDDILNSNLILKKIITKIKSSKSKIFLGDVCYHDNFKYKKIVRYFSAKNFKPWMMFLGLMPPHTGAVIHRDIYKTYKLYDEKIKIAGDFEFFLRIFVKNNQFYKNLNFCVARMRTGGVSGKNIFSHIISSNEIIKSFKKNNLNSFFLLIYLRFIAKIHQLFIFNEKKLNREFNFKLNLYYLKIAKYDFKILEKLKNLNFKKNFTLSALNLAFLGSYAREEIITYDELINWPDGVFAKVVNKKLGKIPGREIVRNLKIPKYIKKITILGNISERSQNYLEKVFKRKINKILLPFGNFNKITKDLNYKIKKNELIFITLPTPKQEQVAKFLKDKNIYFKIICIGGSINIASGEEKEVPNYLSRLEFLWRLRYDTIRRLNRLMNTFVQYLIATFITKKFRNKSAKII